MFALRRCSTTLSRSIPAAAISSRTLGTSWRSLSLARLHIPQVNRVAAAAFHQSARWRQGAAAQSQAEEVSANNEPITRFEDLATRGLVHPNIVRTVTGKMKLETMTDVQTRTINEALSGVDVIAQAKTGTGKTLGFLIPIAQRIIQNNPQLAERGRGYKRARSNDIRAIIVSPTRELAEQITIEAKKLTSATGLIVQAAVGGTQKRAMLAQAQKEGCHILVGTPGRLNDVLSDVSSGIDAPQLDAFVLDEADRLLDDGFQHEIDQIKSLLPDPREVERQNLMFSATIPRNVVDLARSTMRPGFHFAKCINENEVPTHEKVPQKLVHLAGFENIMPAIYELVLKQVERTKAGEAPPFKAIIYFNSTAQVTLASSAFYKLSGGFQRNKPLYGVRSYEIHAKLSQAGRTRAAENFRHCQSGILFSSDVTARGMDFPNVTHIIQVGLPRDRDTYIHRIGRTGRAGKEGEGWTLVAPIESTELRNRLRNLPLKEDRSLETASVNMSEPSQVPENVASILGEVVEAHKRADPQELGEAFRSFFGSFQWVADKQSLIQDVNRLAEFGWGMDTPPRPPSYVYQNPRDRFGGGGRGGGPPRRDFGDRRGGFLSRDSMRGRDGYRGPPRSSFSNDRRGSWRDNKPSKFHGVF